MKGLEDEAARFSGHAIATGFSRWWRMSGRLSSRLQPGFSTALEAFGLPEGGARSPAEAGSTADWSRIPPAKAGGKQRPAEARSNFILVNLYRLSALVLLLTVVAVVLTPCAGRAVEVETAAPGFEYIDVPADDASLWPKGDWAAMSLEEFQRLSQSAQSPPPGPSPVVVDRVEYTAAFADGKLAGGTFSALLTNKRRRRGFLPLDPFDVAVSDVAWLRAGVQHAAVVGADRDKRTMLVVDAGDEHLVGRFSAYGQRKSGVFEFDLKLMPATTSELVLTAPAGHSVSASVGDVAGPQTSDKADWNRWVVRLGSRNVVRITIHPAGDQTPPRRTTLVTTEESFILKQQELEFESTFLPEFVGFAGERLSFILPAEASVHSVTYGNDVMIPVKPIRRGNELQVNVRLLDPVKGKSRPIRLRGSMPVRSTQRLVLPRIQLTGSLFLSGRTHVRVSPPLEAFDVKTSGYRQEAVIADPALGETLTFSRFRDDCEMTIEAGLPRLDLSAEVAVLFDATSTDWSAVGEIGWRARVGSTYQVACMLPPEWELRDLHTNSTRDDARIASWRIEEGDDDSRRLIVEFVEALAPAESKSVSIHARRRPTDAEYGGGLRLPEPLECSSVEYFASVDHPPGVEIHANAEPRGDRIAAEDIPEFARDSAVWSIPTDSKRGVARFLFQGRPASGRFAGMLIDLLDPNDPSIVADRGNAKPPPGAGRKPVEVGTAGPHGILEAPPPADHGPDSNIEPVDQLSGPIKLRLESRLDAASGGRDLHRAVFTLPAIGERRSFGFQLQPPALITASRIDGLVVVPVRRDNRFTLPDAPRTECDVAIEYTTPAATVDYPTCTRRIPVPVVEGEVTDFRWRIALPRGMSAAELPDGVAPTTAPEMLAPAQRFFGPLGRAAGDQFFNPLESADWRSLFTDASTDAASRSVEAEAAAWTEFSQTGYHVVEATGPMVPAVLELRTWRPGAAHLAAWIVMLGTLICGLLLRTYRIRRREGFGAVFAAAYLTAAWLAPDWYAIVAGGGLVGVVIVALLPRRLIVRFCGGRRNQRVVDENAPLTGRQAAVVLGLLVGCLTLTGAGSAQESVDKSRKVSAGSSTGPAKKNKIDEGPVGRLTESAKWRVLNPVEGKNADAAPVVFLEPPVIEELRLRSARLAPPEWLLVQADYRATVDSDDKAELTALYRVAVFVDSGPVHIPLPIKGAWPAGPESCRVNGRPHRLSIADDGATYILTIDDVAAHAQPLKKASDPLSDAAANIENGARQRVRPLFQQAVDSDEPPPPSLPEAAPHDASLHERVMRFMDVELDLKPPTTPIRGGGRIEVSVPRVPSASLEATLPGDVVFAATSKTTAEFSERDDATPRITVSAGQSKSLDVAWTRTSAPGPEPQNLTADVACIVKPFPTYAEIRCRVEYRFDGGEVERVAWQLPPQAVLRDVHSVGQSSVRTRWSNQRLLIERNEPGASSFTVEGVFLLPVRPNDAGVVRIPSLNPIGGRALDPDAPSATLGTYRVGVVAPDQFVVESNSNRKTVPWDVANISGPERAWTRPTPLSIRVEPKRPLRALSAVHVVSLGRDRLTWTLSATIEVRNASVFRHRVRLDRRFDVQSVSVVEDGVDRLARFRRTGEELELSLLGRTTGVQQLELVATMPWGRTPGRLPRVVVEATEVVSETLTIVRDSDSNFEIKESGLFEPIDNLDDPTFSNQTLLGSFRLNRNGPSPLLRPAALGEPAKYDVASSIFRGPQGRWKLRSLVRVTGVKPDDPPPRLQIPVAVLTDPSVVVNGVPIELPPQANNGDTLLKQEGVRPLFQQPAGTMDVPLSDVRNWGAPVIVEVEAGLDLSEARPTTIGLRVEPLRPGDNLLAVDPQSHLTPHGPGVEELPAERIPAWARNVLIRNGVGPADLETARGRGQVRVWRNLETDWNCTSARASVKSTPKISLLKTSIWLTGSSTCIGATEFLIERDASLAIDVDWPDDVTLRAVEGDALERMERTEPDNLRLYIESQDHGASDRPIQLTLHWSAPVKLDSLLDRVKRRIPVPSNAAVERALLRITPPSDSRVLEAVPATSPQASSPEQQGTSADRKRADADELNVELANDGFVAADPNATSVQFWLLRRGLTTWTFAGVCLIVVSLILSGVVTRKTAEWLHVHVYAAWILLGLTWWLFLRPGPVGLLLLSVAVAVAARELRQRTHSTNSAEHPARAV